VGLAGDFDVTGWGKGSEKSIGITHWFERRGNYRISDSAGLDEGVQDHRAEEKRDWRCLPGD